MTREIIEGNKLIAKFMGAKSCKDWQGYDGFEHENWFHLQWINRYQDNLEVYSYRFSELLYNSSWKWLMTVIDKIENLSDLRNIKFELHKDWCFLSFYSKTENIDNHGNYKLLFSESFKGYSKKESAWIAVVEFIKWYNDFNKNCK